MNDLSTSAPYDLFDYQEFWKGRDYDRQSEAGALRALLVKIVKMGRARNLLLDAGCGYGRNAYLYRSLFKKIVLLDPSEKELNQARTLLKDYSNLSYQKGSIEALPFPDNTFDCIFCVRVLHHLENPRPAVLELSRALKKEGFLILEVANFFNWKTRFVFLMKGRHLDISNPTAQDKRSAQSKDQETIPFVNHNPLFIKDFLEQLGFCVEETFSAGNFRSPLTRNSLLRPLFLLLDRIFYHFLGKVWFGPSIIFLAQRKIDQEKAKL